MTGADETLKDIERAVKGIEELLAASSTLSVVGACFAFYLGNWNPGQDLPKTMVSPARQISFLLGKLLATPEPSSPREFGRDEWSTAERLLNSAFVAYAGLFWPDPESTGRPSEEWLRVRDVVMPAFLHHFNTGRPASVEQLRERIRRYLSPFDPSIQKTWGLTATEALSIANHISAGLQEAVDRLRATFDRERSARLRLLDRAKAEQWGIAEIRAAAQEPEYRTLADAMLSELTSLGWVDLEQLRAVFPESADAYWRTFSVTRGSAPALRYPTDPTVFDDHPLVVLQGHHAMVPMANGLLSAILNAGERILSEGPGRDRYFEQRDKSLEAEVRPHLLSLVGEAQLFANAFETPDAHFEHDLVIASDALCLLVEVKATPPDPPFRDPDKALLRLRRAFSGETGVQHAYEQALRLWRRLNAGEDVTLYDRRGVAIGVVSGSRERPCYCLCVTRESYGPLATDLALLQVAAGEPYPWVTNVLDLEAIAEMWRHRGWGARKLQEYLRDRTKLYGKAFSADELDYVGFFIRHGGLHDALNAPADKLLLDGQYSDMFDDLYHHLRYGTAKPDTAVKPPVMTDLRRALMGGSGTDAKMRTARHVAKNARCPCGSGKRFRKCCRRKG